MAENSRLEKLGKGSNLQDRVTFTTYADAPRSGYWDERYFSRSHRYTRHWCLLAEITSVETYTRLVLTVRDMAGQSGLKIACYDSDGGRKFMQRAVMP